MNIAQERIWLRIARHKADATMEDVARAVGIPFTTYYRIEKGLTEPRVEKALLICEYLNADIWNFLRGPRKLMRKGGKAGG